MTSAIFLVLAVLLAGLDWYAAKEERRRISYFARPGVMAALLIWLLLQSGRGGLIADERVQPLFWFAVGVTLFAAGDVFLMLPRQRPAYATASFWLAQLAYLQGFGWVRWTERYLWVGWILALMFAAAAIRTYLRIAKALHEKGRDNTQPVFAIHAAITSALALAGLTSLVSGGWRFIPSYLASGGALLFYGAAITFARDRLVAPIEHASLRIRFFYALGQIGLIVGATLRYTQ